jgi:hypothetical protein
MVRNKSGGHNSMTTALISRDETRTGQPRPDIWRRNRSRLSAGQTFLML